MKLSFINWRAGKFPRLAVAAALALSASAQAGPSVSTTSEAAEKSAFGDWLGGKYALPDIFGARKSLEDRGITFDNKWRGTFYGLTGGGKDATGRTNVARGAFDEEIQFNLKLDFFKLTGIEILKGLTASGGVRYRDGYSPNNYVGASNAFNPSRYQSGQQWRLMPFSLTYTTPELFGAKDFLTLSGGWQNAYDIFAESSGSKFFTNSAIGTSKGIGANGVPWSSSYAAWGGYLKIKPVDWYYAMAGLYEAIPNASNYSNHGLYFEGYTPDRSLNGIYAVGETGFTPKIGPSELPGKYAFGGYYFGVENKTYNGDTRDGRYGFYWQADQMLFREPSPSAESAPLAKGPSDGKDAKSFKSPVDPEPAKLSDQGLSLISFVNYAPSSDNLLPFFFYTGLLYQGLIPGRDKDQLGVAFAYGNYSDDKIQNEQAAGIQTHQTYEAVVEAGYRIQLTKFVYTQPFWQYIIRPNGNGTVPNANIFGLHMGVSF